MFSVVEDCNPAWIITFALVWLVTIPPKVILLWTTAIERKSLVTWREYHDRISIWFRNQLTRTPELAPKVGTPESTSSYSCPSTASPSAWGGLPVPHEQVQLQGEICPWLLILWGRFLRFEIEYSSHPITRSHVIFSDDTITEGVRKTIEVQMANEIFCS